MKVVNKTRYRTDDLRRFFRAGLEALGAGTRKKIIVTEKGRRKRSCASLGGDGWEASWIHMVIDPTNPKADGMSSGRGNDFAATFVHEVQHNLGLRHEDMHPDVMWCRCDTPWAEGLEIREKPVRPKPPIVEVRAARARTMLARYERRLRLTKTLVARWRRKVAYYDRRSRNNLAAVPETQ